MTEEDKKLLAFFAAHAGTQETNRFQEYIIDEQEKERFNLCGAFYFGKPKYSMEELKFIYAKAMLEKYKEFCSL